MKETYKNYFSRKSAAQRYAKGRPHFHSFVIRKVQQFLALPRTFSRSLDVGCGTGLSSLALKEISAKVVGIDISSEMLKLAATSENVEYLSASAENLPFVDGEFDFLTISQAIHWIDNDKFFAEAGRILKNNAWIVVYDNYFLGQTSENPAFNIWYNESFLKNYPLPPRGKRIFATESQNAKDFVLKHEEMHKNTIDFSATEMVDFLLTISNVIAAVENGAQNAEEVSQNLTASIRLFFDGDEKKSFTFAAPIWYLQRNL